MENIKRAVGDASTFLTRAVQDAHIGDEATVIYNRAKQFTEEKLGKAERTENDPHYENLAKKTDKAKLYTEKLVKDVEAVLVPNPAARLETFMFDNIPVDKIGLKDTRLSNLEYLGADMIEAGNEFGPGTPYGSALISVGQTEQALGEVERNYIRAGHDSLIAPQQKFLDGEMRNIMRERKILENKRLDLDACKNKVRKARAMQMQPPKDGVDPRALLDQAETELRIAQADYDKQVEITKLLMEGLSSIQTNHLKYLCDFVDSQVKFYSECHMTMQELQKDLTSVTHMTAGQTSTPILRNTINQPGPTTVTSSVAGQANGNNEVENHGDLHQINLTSPPAVNASHSNQTANFF